MAEDELEYASVVFKSNKRDRQKAEMEETVYANVKKPAQTTTPTAGTTPGFSSGKDSGSSRLTHQQWACAIVTLCFLFVSAVVLISLYVVTLHQEKEQLQTNKTLLLADNNNLTALNVRLSSDNTNLKSDINNLKMTCTDEIQNLTMENQELMMLNQDLENDLIRTQSSEVNVSRAQWSIDAYCSQGRRCKNCQEGWESHRSSCYAIVDSKKVEEWRSWNEARDDCKKKGSDLVVIDNEEEKKFVERHSWESSRERGYWIGLRVTAGKWKWLDGREFNSGGEKPVEGQCAISYRGGRTPVSCDKINRWICEKKALSVE